MRSRRVSRNQTLPPKKRARHSPDENHDNSYGSHRSQVQERRQEHHNAISYNSQREETRRQDGQNATRFTSQVEEARRQERHNATRYTSQVEEARVRERHNATRYTSQVEEARVRERHNATRYTSQVEEARVEERHNATRHTSHVEETRCQERRNATCHTSHVEEARRQERTLQRLSPRGCERSQRVGVNDLRSSSIERKDSARHIDGHNSKDQLRYDERIMGRNSPSMDYSWKYRRVPEATTNLNGEVIDSLKFASNFESTMSIINRERVSRSSALDGCGMVGPKSLHVDDEIGLTPFTLQPNERPTLSSGRSSADILLASSTNSNVGRYKGELLCRDNLSRTKIPSREYYKDDEKMFSSRNVPQSMMLVSQPMGFQSTLSTLQKDESLANVTASCPPFLPGGISDYSLKMSDPFVQDQYHGGAPTFGSARQPKDVIYARTSLTSPRGEPREYGYLGIQRQEKDDMVYPSTELYKKMQSDMEGYYENRVSTREHRRELEANTINDLHRSPLGPAAGRLGDHESLGERPVANYLHMSRKFMTERDIKSLSTGSKYLEFGERVSSDHESSHPRGGYGFGMETVPVDYKERPKTPPRAECAQDLGRFDISMSHQKSLKVEDVDKYDPLGKTQKRKYDIAEEMNRQDPRSTLSVSGNISMQVDEFNDVSKHRAGEDPDALPSSKPSAFTRLQRHNENASPRVSASQRVSSHMQGVSTTGHEMNGQKPNIKKRLKYDPRNVQGPSHSDSRQDFHKTENFHKRSSSDQNGRVIVNRDGPSQSKALPMIAEPPEASKEFKQLVHKAFLRFSKQLNETSAQQRRYKEQGKLGSVVCCVCGSNSKEFANTRNLVAHCFSSPKVNLRADHLGLHKALCVLMRWDSDTLSGNTWIHKVLPDAEALALKENLILWPPLVIIHNSSIGNKNPDEQKVVTIEGMEAILRDLGFNLGTTKICRGKPANHSIMIVKFIGTFSGLQEAERLHKYYALNKRGREDFQHLTKGANMEKPEVLLYGYLGISDDLDKLEMETKKRCLVKSKTDILTIADASLTGTAI